MSLYRYTRRDHAVQSEHHERLQDWRDTYTDRRTIGRQMLDRAEKLVKDAIAENTAYFEGKIEQAQETAERWEKHYRLAEEQRSNLKRMLDEKRTLAETRSKEGEEVRVQIARPDWKGWQICDLEEIAYRLRCGGAVDETPVKIDSREASALVPAPDLVKLESPRHVTPSEKVAAILTPERPEPKRWSRGRTLVMASSGGALGALFVAILGRLL